MKNKENLNKMSNSQNKNYRQQLTEDKKLIRLRSKASQRFNFRIRYQILPQIYLLSQSIHRLPSKKVVPIYLHLSLSNYLSIHLCLDRYQLVLHKKSLSLRIKKQRKKDCLIIRILYSQKVHLILYFKLKSKRRSHKKNNLRYKRNLKISL